MKKAHAKINIFLKIVGTREEYHEICSRFVLLDNIYDTLEFVDYVGDDFLICDNKFENSIIHKARLVMSEVGFGSILDDFFNSNSIKLIKNIPVGAGLGGGSSDAATFIMMLNDELNLKLNTKELMHIGSKIGSDVPFFISGYKSANVSGIGEVIECFDDEIPSFEIFTPPIFCSTPLVYSRFRDNFLNLIDEKMAKNIVNLSSCEILSNYKPKDLNDLLLPCLELYPELLKYSNFDYFMSGSGSTFFKKVE